MTRHIVSYTICPLKVVFTGSPSLECYVIGKSHWTLDSCSLGAHSRDDNTNRSSFPILSCDLLWRRLQFHPSVVCL